MSNSLLKNIKLVLRNNSNPLTINAQNHGDKNIKYPQKESYVYITEILSIPYIIEKDITTNSKNNITINTYDTTKQQLSITNNDKEINNFMLIKVFKEDSLFYDIKYMDVYSKKVDIVSIDNMLFLRSKNNITIKDIIFNKAKIIYINTIRNKNIDPLILYQKEKFNYISLHSIANIKNVFKALLIQNLNKESINSYKKIVNISDLKLAGFAQNVIFLKVYGTMEINYDIDNDLILVNDNTLNFLKKIYIQINTNNYFSVQFDSILPIIRIDNLPPFVNFNRDTVTLSGYIFSKKQHVSKIQLIDGQTIDIILYASTINQQML